jgi:hypothetical protein
VTLPGPGPNSTIAVLWSKSTVSSIREANASLLGATAPICVGA